MMAQLTPQQTQVLCLRFGLVEGRELTFSEIGSLYNVSKQRVHQIAFQAIALMKSSNQAPPEATAPETAAAVNVDTMPVEEAEVSALSAPSTSALSTPNIEDLWEAILSNERISDTNANELLLLIK